MTAPQADRNGTRRECMHFSVVRCATAVGMALATINKFANDMPYNSHLDTDMDRRSLLLGLSCLFALIGCGRRGEYPRAKVTSPLDRPGTCHHCGKPIASVTANNIVSVKAAQYVVCDERCAAAIKEWHESQFGK